jgi:hypothetical protein
MSVFKFTRSEMAAMSESVARECVETVNSARTELSVEPEVRFAADEALLKVAQELQFQNPAQSIEACIRRAITLHPNLALLSRAPVTRAYAAVRAAS